MLRRKHLTATARPDLWSRLDVLARNLWWTWNPNAQRLWAALDPVQWEATNHNPLRVLAGLAAERRATLAETSELVALLAECERELRGYLTQRTWFQRHATPALRRLCVAYFCAEYGLHECLPQYAGGLGVLAGDHLKSASDLGIPLVAVGLLYRCGYYRQELRRDGATHAVFERLRFDELPLTDTGCTIRVPIGRRRVHAKIWRVIVGRVSLFLLDADIAANTPRDRAITERLYGGDQETRIQQEILLGVGGVQALSVLGIRPTVFHLNEGHAAFCALERLRAARQAGQSWERALSTVAASGVFTTHTPVPAGHDRFAPRLMRKHLGYLTAALSVDENQWLALGREQPADRRADFCMTVLALRLSRACNGVSAIHGAVSREMWKHIFGTGDPRGVPIGHVTNGVHVATWLAPEMRALYDRYLHLRWMPATPRDERWERARQIPPAELWRTRQQLRRRLVEIVRQRVAQQLARRAEPQAADEVFDEHALTIGFARRFATYKRALLVFRDPRRLTRLLHDPRRPVQIVFAGKAHPADRDGQAFLQQVYRWSRQPAFRGRVVLLEDYDMHVGRVLTAGCDVWLNNPRPPQEASGTSGMKPALHGGLNCSILDGWWLEAYDGHNGWAIDSGPPAARPAEQDRRDAEALYRLLERAIVPLFYERDRGGVPRRWVQRMQAAIASVGAQFNTHRMLADYLELYRAE
jgi:glycogen phosphorylase